MKSEEEYKSEQTRNRKIKITKHMAFEKSKKNAETPQRKIMEE